MNDWSCCKGPLLRVHGKKKIIFYFSTKNIIVLNDWVRKYLRLYAEKFCLSKPVAKGMKSNPPNHYAAIGSENQSFRNGSGCIAFESKKQTKNPRSELSLHWMV